MNEGWPNAPSLAINMNFEKKFHVRTFNGTKFEQNRVKIKLGKIGIAGTLLLMPIFANPYPKAQEEESPMKSKAQRPTKKTKEQERSKERNVRESNL